MQPPLTEPLPTTTRRPETANIPKKGALPNLHEERLLLTCTLLGMIFNSNVKVTPAHLQLVGDDIQITGY
jgi:hypothetical protein